MRIYPRTRRIEEPDHAVRLNDNSQQMKFLEVYFDKLETESLFIVPCGYISLKNPSYLEFAQKIFSLDSMIGGYAKLYRELIGNKK